MADKNLSNPNTGFAAVPGGAELLAWFGYVPIFHDAEIISLHLNRSGISTLKVHTWDWVQEGGTNTAPRSIKNVIVAFALEDIAALELRDFSIQNVISRLELRVISPNPPSFNMRWLHLPEPPQDVFEIFLEDCFGLHGRIQARRVSINLTPGKPDDTLHSD